ncbi:MAG: signal recognition particle protein [Pseudomonadota bacterium]|nr:signal recognition particle protein [Pseudomonadota bacterium]
MFNQLTQKLSSTLKSLSGRGRLSESNIQEALKEIRHALIDADVALPVVQKFVKSVNEHAIGQEVLGSLKPAETLTRVVNDELVEILGSKPIENPLPLNVKPPAVILVAGLQGAGKTTTVAKLGKWLKELRKKNVITTSLDIQRPAAIEQLEKLSERANVDFYKHPNEKDTYNKRLKAALDHATKNNHDALIVDTAGRLHVDEDLMAEIKDIHALANPCEVLLVVDSMMGQDAAHVAKSFDDALPITGTIITKLDADVRGGAALSIVEITQKPIVFICEGEHLDKLDEFDPTRIASQILGMGDIVSLVKQVEKQIDEKRSKETMAKIRKNRFDIDAFQGQLEEMIKMDNMESMMGKLPGFNTMSDEMKNQLNSQIDIPLFKRMLAATRAMTPKERAFPDLIKGSRKRRIAIGSGNDIQMVNKLMKRFKMMQKMSKKLQPGSNSNLLNRFKNSDFN